MSFFEEEEWFLDFFFHILQSNLQYKLSEKP